MSKYNDDESVDKDDDVASDSSGIVRVANEVTSRYDHDQDS